MTTLSIALTVEETNQILTLLGDQAIKTGLGALAQNIKAQGDEQVAQINRNAANSQVTDVTDVKEL